MRPYLRGGSWELEGVDYTLHDRPTFVPVADEEQGPFQFFNSCTP